MDAAAAGEGLTTALQLSDILFYLFALFTVAGGAGVAFSRNVVYSAFSLLAALLGVAAIFIWLSADLLAVVQVLVYIGGILVLILFAIMLTSRIGDSAGSNPSISVVPGAAVFSLLVIVLWFVSVKTPWGQVAGHALPRLRAAGLEPTSAAIGDALLTDFLLPFEIASVVLLAVVIGAVIVARKEMRVLIPGDTDGGAQ